MFAGHEDAGSSGWQATGEVRSDGWPLGLQQDPMIRGFPEAPVLFISTPSVTSDSSSDLDTESTGSFFPERSHTLGSLIGIQANAHNKQMSKELIGAQNSMVAETEKRRSTSITGASGGGGLVRGRPSWCSMLGCGGSNPGALGMSPSLAHLLEEERRSTGSQRQVSNSNYSEGGAQGAEMPTGLLNMERNTLFDAQGILPPQPSGAPLKLILQQSSPSSSYLSADWNVFNSRHPPGHHTSAREDGAGRFPTFWPAGFCGRLGTGLAG
ncbi:hypothetical protein GOP47_0009201 [Adiantum capillus-veneris]|uniref:Uncharacterized protein n=1 Tax=Adiantum capillus-veneris TaxID=13818 RepID=A0A9D4UWK0_ADICA|nr:hypothetical protein GOP47_0009201 [Adiantum capillus-veneris]